MPSSQRSSASSVSVVAPARNAAHFFPGWLRSIEAQVFPNLEVLLVDDGSEDTDQPHSLFAHAASAPSFVRYIRTTGVGPAAARNLAIAQAGGDYIAFLDLDDRWTRGHLQRLVSALDDNREAGIAQGLIRKFFIAEDGQAFLCSDPYRFVNLGAAVYRCNVFDVCGLFDSGLRFGEDFDFTVRCWERGIQRIDVPEVSLLYHRHDGNMTNGKSVVDLGAVRVYKRRLDRLRAGLVDPRIVEERRVNFADYLGRTVGPFDEGVREAFTL